MSAQILEFPPPPSWLLAREAEIPFRFRAARLAQAGWAAQPLAARAEALHRVGDRLLSRQAEVVAALREENGKAEVEALGHEVGGALAALRWCADHGRERLSDRPNPVTWLPHRRIREERVPYGVVLIIAPWNFPLSIPFGQVAAAVLAGNAVILKPSEHSPRLGALVGELFADAGLPADLIQVVQGDGAVGAALIEAHPDKFAFTGSLATGRKVMAACARFPIPVALELGGVDALIVCDDADIELASSAALWGATFNGGQVCASVERILVDASVHDAFMGRLLAKLERIDPLRDLGPCAMAGQGKIWDRHLADARKRGLTVHGGGEWIGKRLPAAFIEGAGIEAADVYRDETFGPIAAIRVFRGDDEAISAHNDTPYGLTASVFSGDPARAERLARRLRAGIVSVNEVAATLHAFGEVPWGGVGASGFGRSHGAEGLLDFTWGRTLDLPAPGVPSFKRPWWYPYDTDQREVIDGFVSLVGARDLATRLRGAAKMTASFLPMLRRSPRI